MPKATDTLTTSRRAVVGGAFLTLVGGTAMASTKGVGFVTSLSGPDADLLCLCAEFHEKHAIANRVIDDDEVEDALEKRWDISTTVKSIIPRTSAGLRAKAAVALVLLTEQNGTDSDEPYLQFVFAALRNVMEA